MLTKSLCIASKSGSRLRVKYKHGVIRGAATTTLSWEPFSARLWPHQANPQRRCLNSRETSHAATVSRAATKKSRDREGSTPIGSPTLVQPPAAELRQLRCHRATPAFLLKCPVERFEPHGNGVAAAKLHIMRVSKMRRGGACPHKKRGTRAWCGSLIPKTKRGQLRSAAAPQAQNTRKTRKAQGARGPKRPSAVDAL